MKRVDTFMLVVALWISLGGCGECCLEGDACRPTPTYEPAECVWTRAEPTQADLGDTCVVDEFEPNGSLPHAAVSRTGHECAPTTKSANIADDDDVDVFRTGKCDLGAGVVSASTLMPALDVETDADLRACIFPTCHGGSTNVYKCETEETSGEKIDLPPVLSPTFFHGCCRVGRGRITATLDCPLDGAEVDTYVWVDAGPALLDKVCVPYSVTWHLN